MFAEVRRRDVLIAAGVIAFGVFSIGQATRYSLGELRNIGPGAFPLIVSCLIVLAGVLIAAESLIPNQNSGRDQSQDRPNVRALIYVPAGLLSFAVITPVFGALPGIVVCIFLAAQADGSLKLWQVAVLAAMVAAFCAVVFVVLLNLPLDLVEW